MTLQEIITLGHKMMRKAKLHPHFFGQNTLLENAQYLAFYALQLPHEYQNPIFLKRQLTAAEEASIMALYNCRIKERLPVEYITGEATYLGHKFFVNKHVLVPRSLMNTRFNEFLNQVRWQNYKVLDLCAGSGCIGISLALMQPNIHVDLADISIDALHVARANITKHNLTDRVHCVHSDLFSQVRGKYDLIISNPPYVATKDYQRAPQEFKREPRISLECAQQGLAIINSILKQAQAYLNPHGMLIMEVGYNSARLIKKQYKHLDIKWLPYKHPAPAANWFQKYIYPLVAMDCIFICNKLTL